MSERRVLHLQRSTAIVLAVFLGALVLYLFVRPDPVPPGFVRTTVPVGQVPASIPSTTRPTPTTTRAATSTTRRPTATSSTSGPSTTAGATTTTLAGGSATTTTTTSVAPASSTSVAR
jgi:hypothetical protein